MIETLPLRRPAGLSSPTAASRAFHLSPHRWRLLGGLAFSLLSLGACVLLARYLSGTSWPLEGAHVPLVFLAGGAYLASFGFRAFGWHQLFPSRERPDGARCLAACGASAASGVVLPFRLDYVVKIFLLRRLGGVRLGLPTIAVSIVALGMVDAVAMLPLAVAALATSGPILRAPLVVVVLFCVGCLGILTLGQRVARLPLVGRSNRLHGVYRRVADSTQFTRPTLVAGFLLLGCWTSRALGSTLLLSAIGVRFSPTLALAVLCLSAATAILPITAGGAVAGMGTTAGVLFALGVSQGRGRTERIASAHVPRAPGARRSDAGTVGQHADELRSHDRRPSNGGGLDEDVGRGGRRRPDRAGERGSLALRVNGVTRGLRLASAAGEPATALSLGRGVVELVVVIEG